ncbi:Lysosome membrane protein 2 [Orchesella cincta]|uniref:Lysosome membrane protein 2 n=1 Tax=Orchesella cincta TaxID=48709 RepID=A0A1D2NIA2_ORCCI|nr:Lysosome membrane protein 2 [Orchesella cincta]
MQAAKVVLGIGIAITVLAVGIGWVIFPQLLQRKITSQIRLEEGGELFERWVDIPVPIYMKVYFFNVTNPAQVRQGEKPILAELGPYVYQQKRQRVVESISVENDTILFRPKITYYFRPDMSEERLETDVITLIDIPYVGVVRKAMTLSPFARSLIRDISVDHNKELFMHRTVAELTFTGYKEPLMKDLADLQGEELLPNNTFGIYYGKNGTAGDLMQIYSGVGDNTLFGETISWKGNDMLSFWETDYCNMINGSDGSVFPPFVTRDRVLRIFSPDMCRSIYMKYHEDVEVLGVPGYRFITPREVLEDPKVYPENTCYCTEPGDDLEGCAKAGVFYLAPCRKGAPVVVSWPHFYDGDEIYVQQSVGLEPNKDKHETFIVLEPNTGSLIKASKRFQINVELKPTKHFAPMKKVQTMLMPILWADESVQLNEDNAEMINNKLMKPIQIVTIGAWSTLVVGLVLILIGSLLFARKDKKDFKG